VTTIQTTFLYLSFEKSPFTVAEGDFLNERYAKELLSFSARPFGIRGGVMVVAVLSGEKVGAVGSCVEGTGGSRSGT
jgi:hypothetical protein